MVGGGVAQRLCSPNQHDHTVQRRRGEEILHCVRRAGEVMTCAALALAIAKRLSFCLHRLPGVQSRRTRVVGEGVSAHVNVMDGFVASSSSFSA
jgi:hypothetical protein